MESLEGFEGFEGLKGSEALEGVKAFKGFEGLGIGTPITCVRTSGDMSWGLTGFQEVKNKDCWDSGEPGWCLGWLPGSWQTFENGFAKKTPGPNT